MGGGGGGGGGQARRIIPDSGFGGLIGPADFRLADLIRVNQVSSGRAQFLAQKVRPYFRSTGRPAESASRKVSLFR